MSTNQPRLGGVDSWMRIRPITKERHEDQRDEDAKDPVKHHHGAPTGCGGIHIVSRGPPLVSQSPPQHQLDRQDRCDRAAKSTTDGNHGTRKAASLPGDPTSNDTCRHRISARFEKSASQSQNQDRRCAVGQTHQPSAKGPQDDVGTEHPSVRQNGRPAIPRGAVQGRRSKKRPRVANSSAYRRFEDPQRPTRRRCSCRSGQDTTGRQPHRQGDHSIPYGRGAAVKIGKSYHGEGSSNFIEETNCMSNGEVRNGRYQHYKGKEYVVLGVSA